jgi:predicted enzyme related to lactoylglutathione lyase
LLFLSFSNPDAYYLRNKQHTMSFKNAISWFEIPATDLDRAQKFYEAIFGIQMIPMDMPNIKMRMFPLDDMMGVGGALCDSGGFHKPSATDGPLIYLNGNPDVQVILDRVVAAGGTVIVPKTEISPDYGYMGVFIDSEGNRIGLHSVPQQ